MYAFTGSKFTVQGFFLLLIPEYTSWNSTFVIYYWTDTT